MLQVFITGCATGFGNALARQLLGDGYRVVATDPDAEAVRRSLGEHPNLTVLSLDITRPEQVADAAQRAGEIDVLVNNGGIAVFGTQEEADLEKVRKLFEVNVLGTARITQALLPTLRRRKGTIVQLSSIAGRMVFPESGFYAASKYALEAMSEALFQEVGAFGVKVRLIQPGNFDTPFQAHAAQNSPPPPLSSVYSDFRPIWNSRREQVLCAPHSASLVVNAIIQSLTDPRGFIRIPVGEDAVRILQLRSVLAPDAWVRLMAQRHGIDEEIPTAGDIWSDSDSILAAQAAGFLESVRAEKG